MNLKYYLIMNSAKKSNATYYGNMQVPVSFQPCSVTGDEIGIEYRIEILRNNSWEKKDMVYLGTCYSN